jgi:hypothetical protein
MLGQIPRWYAPTYPIYCFNVNKPRPDTFAGMLRFSKHREPDGRIYLAVGQISSLVCSDFAKQTSPRENFRYLLGRLDAAFAGEILTFTF